jgi:hypothetical protein
MRSLNYQLISVIDPTLDPQKVRLADRSKNFDHLFRCRSSRLNCEAIGIPDHRQVPQLLKTDEGPARDAARFAPEINRFFRPEEKHGRSGMNNVVPPMRCGNRKVCDVRSRDRLPTFDFKC